MSGFHSRYEGERPEPGFPMPNDEMRDISVASGWCIVVASVYYRDDIATVLVLFREPPFFGVGHYFLTDVDAEGDAPARRAGDLVIHVREMNIVPAVEAYEQWGGDY